MRGFSILFTHMTLHPRLALFDSLLKLHASVLYDPASKSFKHSPAQSAIRLKAREYLLQIFNEELETNPESSPITEYQKQFCIHSLSINLWKNHYGIIQSISRDFGTPVRTENFFYRPGCSKEFTLESVLSMLFDGQELEQITLDTRPNALPSSFWNDWTVKDPKCWKKYRTAIHPFLAHVALSYANKSSLFLEIGGGTGELANDILSDHTRPHSYIMSEINQIEIEKAKELLGSRAIVVEQNAVADEIYYSNSAKSEPIHHGTVDVAIASGLLTKEVLSSKSEAIQITKKVHSLLAPTGIFLVAGNADPLLSKFEFENLNFKVHNCTLPYSERHFYILTRLTQTSTR